MTLQWHEEAWADYVEWQRRDRRIATRINALIKDIARDSDGGLGKPEKLRHDLAGYWSRRIDHEHRLVYRVIDGAVEIASCRHRYED
jgi:toxin YoeB